jgi:two-component system sensor histidine kinase/response regulator
MSEETASALFQPFSQAEGVNTKVGGTGLGLYISKLIVEAMGGTIGVSSRVGAGSTFYFDIAVERSQEKNLVAKCEPALAANQFSGKKQHVLIVEDDPMQRTVMQAVLKTKGCICRASGDPQRALRMARTDHFDVIFVDANLGTRSGVAFVEKLRAYESSSNEPQVAYVIAMSGDIEPREQFVAAGANNFIEKPCLPDNLFAALAAA